ncbi:MAG TPA: type VI secretion system baseplate subunit TssG [Syntrophales bacterium]|nr:type VI secretion system baseplate subunit TssG [Syntrophales bacterium]
MADTNGRSPAKLIERLLKEGHRFTFIQAYRFLLRQLRQEAGQDLDINDLTRQIRVRPELSLAFPDADMVKIEATPPPGRFRITAAFLGLYGSSSPLPTFYTEDLLQELAQDRTVSRDFFDIFNYPLYAIYFAIWKYHHLFYSIAEETDPKVMERLFCLVGLGSETLRKSIDNPYGMLRYIGLATQFPRSAEGLRALLTDGLAEGAIKITQCQERRADIPVTQRLMLGKSGNVLGEDAYLGREIADRTGKFRVHIGPVGREVFSRYLPGEPAFRKMSQYIGFYLDQPLEWDVEVIMNPLEAVTAGIGREAMLGCNTWIFSGAAIPGECRALFAASTRH